MVGKRTMHDELRPEYNLRDLQVRMVAPNRKLNGRLVLQLEPDVAIVVVIKLIRNNFIIAAYPIRRRG